MARRKKVTQVDEEIVCPYPTAVEHLDLDIKGGLAKTAHEQLKAFQIWYALGEQRKYSTVAKMMGLEKSIITAWSSRYNWKRRLAAMDSKVTALIDDKFADLYSEVKSICQQGLFTLMNTALEDIASGDLRIKDIKDLETVMKLDLLIKGEATERTESKAVVHNLKQDLTKLSVEELQTVLEVEVVEEDRRLKEESKRLEAEELDDTLKALP